jgi:hypothetical protein
MQIAQYARRESGTRVALPAISRASETISNARAAGVENEEQRPLHGVIRGGGGDDIIECRKRGGEFDILSELDFGQFLPG